VRSVRQYTGRVSEPGKIAPPRAEAKLTLTVHPATQAAVGGLWKKAVNSEYRASPGAARIGRAAPPPCLGPTSAFHAQRQTSQLGQWLPHPWECGTLIRWTSGWPALVRSRERGSVTRIVIALASRPLRARDRVSARVPLAHAKRGSRPAVANSRSLVGVRAFLALVARRGQGGRGLLGHLRKSASRRLATTADGTIKTASSVWDEVVAHTLPRSADLAPPRPSVPVRSRRGHGACDPVNGHAAWSSAP
jgi:hypothetical protein